VFEKLVHTPIKYITPDELTQYIQRHLKRKKKFYALSEWKLSNGREKDSELMRIARKHNLNRKDKTSYYDDAKLEKYDHPPYPLHLLLILDDFLNNPLLENKMSPVITLLTKLRHYNITVIIANQSTKGISKNCRRLATDIVLWKGCSMTDVDDLLKEVNISYERSFLAELYHTLTNAKDYMEIHTATDEYKIYRYDDDQYKK
jgi:hypothetical protein